MKPFFSIGVTTYNRREMLRECLSSILWQTFSDFEVIVGNDYTRETLSSRELGIEDSRVRFVNYPQNLGEMRNMNSLLQMSQGRYFTWLADDDMYMPTFLKSVHDSLLKFDFPLSVFTSYHTGNTFPDHIDTSSRVGNLLTGRQFLRQYLVRFVKVQGSNGVYDLEYLTGIGGIKRLGMGLGFYSDNLLAIRSGLLEKVVYIDEPQLFFRTHDQSISWTSTDVDAYVSAQEDLLSCSVKVFKSEGLGDDFHSNLFLLLMWCISDIVVVVGRSGFVISRNQVVAYLILLKRYISFLKGSSFYWKAIGLVGNTFSKQIWPIGKQSLISSLPPWVKRPVKRVWAMIKN